MMRVCTGPTKPGTLKSTSQRQWLALLLTANKNDHVEPQDLVSDPKPVPIMQDHFSASVAMIDQAPTVSHAPAPSHPVVDGFAPVQPNPLEPISFQNVADQILSAYAPAPVAPSYLALSDQAYGYYSEAGLRIRRPFPRLFILVIDKTIVSSRLLPTVSDGRVCKRQCLIPSDHISARVNIVYSTRRSRLVVTHSSVILWQIRKLDSHHVFGQFPQFLVQILVLTESGRMVWQASNTQKRHQNHPDHSTCSFLDDRAPEGC
jgi:hypothetical protein